MNEVEPSHNTNGWNCCLVVHCLHLAEILVMILVTN